MRTSSVAAFLLLVALRPCWASDGRSDRATLKGVPAMNVVIAKGEQPGSPGVFQTGLSIYFVGVAASPESLSSVRAALRMFTSP